MQGKYAVLTCLGSAYLTGYALGLLEGVLHWLPPSVVTEASEDTRQVYDEAYRRFLALQSMLST